MTATVRGTGVPLATPFDADGAVDHDALADLVGWLEAHDVNFLVPCGSNGEAPLLADKERAAVIETVCEAATVPVLAGTGTPGLQATLDATRRAADAGAIAALVVTPYYFDHDDATLSAYYRELADMSPLPIYLYSVPGYTRTVLEPDLVDELADHPNVGGIKDSSGDVAAIARIEARTDDGFDVLVGSGGVYAPALDAGADGGVLALANVVPERASDVYKLYHDNDRAGARALNRELVELNHAVTTTHGVAGLKAAMRSRDAPAGRVRSPFRKVNDSVAEELTRMVRDALAADHS